MTTLGPNQSRSIGFDGPASGIAQSLACTRKLGKCEPNNQLNVCTISVTEGEVVHVKLV